MDPETTVANGSAECANDSSEIINPGEGTESTTDDAKSDIGKTSESHNEETERMTHEDERGNCGAQEESSSAKESVNNSELMPDDSSKTLDAENAKCSTESTEEAVEAVTDEISKGDGTPSERIEDEVEASVQKAGTVSETDTPKQQVVSEEIPECTSEQTTGETVEQTTVSSTYEESTTTRMTGSHHKETDLKTNADANLLDPDTVSELRRSPYYDSLIASRISMESESMFSKTSGGDSTEKQVNGYAAFDFGSKGVTSLKDACQEAVKASAQTRRAGTPGSVMFKVTKFEAKSFSEAKSSSDWSYRQSPLFKSGDSRASSHEESDSLHLPEESDFSSPTEDQVHSTEDMGVPPANEDAPFRFSPNAYKPPPEDEMDFIDLPRKKKMFSSSSFYEEPNAIYPTVEEQVELCRKIADSLSDDSNKKSKGANMFFKRVKRAEKWVVQSIGTGYDSDLYESSRSESVTTPDFSKAPYVRVSTGPPQLKLILDPRHLQDMKRLRQEGVNIVEHNAVSPEICLDLVKDLNSPTGRGAQLFAKRKKKSEEWVVDEEKVKQLLRERECGYTSSPEPPTTIPCPAGVEPLIYPRVQMLKTPWAAAMESPIGSCAGAFKQLRPNEVAESVIKAAETKVMTYPAPVRPVIEPVIKPESNVQLQNYPPPAAFAAPPARQQQAAPKRPISTSSFKAGVYTADPYKPRAPRGWTGASTGGSQFFSVQPASLPVAQEPVQSQPLKTMIQAQPPSLPSSKLTHQPSLIRSYSFANFNKTPRAWNEAASAYQSVHMKSVKPPSVLVQ